MKALDVLGAVASARREPAVPSVKVPTARKGTAARDGAPSVEESFRAKFAALMALLSGPGISVRSELLRQLPSGENSLIDRLLSEEGATADAGNGDDGTISQSLRYGMLLALRDGLTAQASVESDAVRTGLLVAVGGSGTGSIPEVDRKDAVGSSVQDLLVRASTRRSIGVEELLARGDTGAAELQRALEVLLAQAGSGATDASGLSAGAEGSRSLNQLERASLSVSGNPTDTRTPVRDSSQLASGFRERVERVIERMKAEHGHDVEIIETTRSQERQDYLYAQGRTRNGPVVTWTRNSAHTSGNAVDVRVDGKWNNPAGYANLQRIAREEGLKTLGMQDPGHLEMTRDPSTLNGAMQSAQARDGIQAPQQRLAGGVAQVASIAGVAGVARIASAYGASAMADSDSSVRVSASATTTGISTGALAEPAAGTVAHGVDSDAGSGTSRHDTHDNRGSGGASSDENAAAIMGSRSSTSLESGNPGISRGVAPSSDTFERAMETQQLRENAAARPVSQLRLHVDTVDGGRDEITIDMRGKNVDTTIVTDSQNAAQLRMRAGELEDALARHGLESDAVNIKDMRKQESSESGRTWSAVVDKEAARVGSLQQSQHGDGASGQNSRERAASSRDWQEENRTRREHGGERQDGKRDPDPRQFN